MWKSIRPVVWSVLLLCGISSGVSWAQAPDPGDVGIYMDPLGVAGTGEIQDFAPFDVYVVGFDLAGGVKGFEYGVTAPPGFTLLETWLPDGVNIGTATNVITELSQCVDGTGPVLMQRLRYIVLEPGMGSAADVPICLSAASPSSWSPPKPLWMDCTNALHPFGVAQKGAPSFPDGCLIFNPSYPGCCPGYDFEVLADDTLVPAGGSVSIAIIPNEFLVQACPPSPRREKTTCTLTGMLGLEFDVEFDPGTIEWTGFAADGDHPVPFVESASSPGRVHVALGTYADASWFESLDTHPARASGYAGFTMSPTGGTATVWLRNIQFRDIDPLVEYPIDDHSFLISTDPTVPVESLSLGALKARY